MDNKYCFINNDIHCFIYLNENIYIYIYYCILLIQTKMCQSVLQYNSLQADPGKSVSVSLSVCMCEYKSRRLGFYGKCELQPLLNTHF